MVEKPSDVMNINELAEYLKLPKPTVYKLAQGGKVPGRKWLDSGVSTRKQSIGGYRRIRSLGDPNTIVNKNQEREQLELRACYGKGSWCTGMSAGLPVSIPWIGMLLQAQMTEVKP